MRVGAGLRGLVGDRVGSCHNRSRRRSRLLSCKGCHRRDSGLGLGSRKCISGLMEDDEAGFLGSCLNFVTLCGNWEVERTVA